MLLIERATSLNTSLSKGELATKSIKDIQTEIRTYVKNRHDALNKSLEDLKSEWRQKNKN